MKKHLEKVDLGETDLGAKFEYRPVWMPPPDYETRHWNHEVRLADPFYRFTRTRKPPMLVIWFEVSLPDDFDPVAVAETIFDAWTRRLPEMFARLERINGAVDKEGFVRAMAAARSEALVELAKPVT